MEVGFSMGQWKREQMESSNKRIACSISCEKQGGKDSIVGRGFRLGENGTCRD